MAEGRADTRMRNNEAQRPSVNVVPRVAQEQNRNPQECNDSGQRRAVDKFTEFALLLRRDDGLPKNILLVGEPSTGKSSLINFLTTAVLEGTYKEVAMSGLLWEAGDSSFSRHLQFFRNMGLSEKEMIALRAKHTLSANFQLPTIIDMPGLEPDEKVIEHILRGEVPHNTEIKSCMTDARQLHQKLTTGNCEERRIDRVIFVHALSKDVNEPLLRRVFDAVRGVDGRSPCIPYFLVVTHIDEAKVPRTRDQDKNVDTLCSILGLKNNKRMRYAEVTNYIDVEGDVAVFANSFGMDWNKQVVGLKILCEVFRRREIQQPPPFRDSWPIALKKGLTKAASSFYLYSAVAACVSLLVLIYAIRRK